MGTHILGYLPGLNWFVWGRVFYAYESTDGVNWFYVHSTRMDMPVEIYVGMIGSFREGKGGNYVVLDHISID